jgi:hypothetical protein
MALINISKGKLKTGVLITLLAGLTMGADSCQQAGVRVLKMDVELGNIAAQSVLMPSGERIDFAYVANALFYQSVMTNDHFVIMNEIPTPTTVSKTSLANNKPSLFSKVVSTVWASAQNENEQLMEEYGFGEQLRTKSKALSQQSVSKAVDPSEVPECLYNMSQQKLAGEVVSFETTFGAGISIGYGTNGAFQNSPVGGSLDFKSTRLQMGLRAVDPLNGTITAAAEGVSHQQDIKGGVNLASILLGLDFFYKTPIASVVSGAMDKSLAAMVTSISKTSQTNSWGDAWETRVMYDPVVANGDTQLLIRGGSRYGMLEGDEFVISNMHYVWEGKPCESKLKYRVPSSYPIANVHIIRKGPDVAIAQVDKYLSDERILPGAQVKLLKMYVAPTK